MIVENFQNHLICQFINHARSNSSSSILSTKPVALRENTFVTNVPFFDKPASPVETQETFDAKMEFEALLLNQESVDQQQTQQHQEDTNNNVDGVGAVFNSTNLINLELDSDQIGMDENGLGRSTGPIVSSASNLDETYAPKQFYFASTRYWERIIQSCTKPVMSLLSTIVPVQAVDLDELEEDQLRLKLYNSDGVELEADQLLTFESLLERDCNDSNEDVRCCLLCGYNGDFNIEGRLLYTGSDTWVCFINFFLFLIACCFCGILTFGSVNRIWCNK